jgi:hypothetical protein
MKKIRKSWTSASARKRILSAVGILAMIVFAAVCFANVLDRPPPRGSVPNPGTQQQELANLTPPTPYNIFEFVGTCAACHGGGIDQQAGHFGNWAGTSMASSARDPIFRANQIGVNNLVRQLTGINGSGNICFRCHSPNGWYGGRFDPDFAGDPEGRTMEHSILLSTDDEGVLCEACHRTIGNVTMMRDDLNPTDPAWNMLAGIKDWPHLGRSFTDQEGDPTIAPGNPYGDTSLQINDGMTYIGKYSGSVDIYFSDLPTPDTASPYTGQTYGIYPPGVPLAGQPVVSADGSTPIHHEVPIGPPIDPATGSYAYLEQSLSLEHPTAGNRPAGYLPTPVPSGNKFVRSPEFCGSCHELAVPILNHGMPEQRTYSEWKYSDYGDKNNPATYTRCQDCHMPTMKHEFADDAPVSLNPDPTVTGWFPYAKDRNDKGGTAFHKFAGANRDLPMMMKLLYPEPDLELIGAPTGNDVRIFPGMLSNRAPMYDRARRNTEISLQNAVDLEILNGPVNTNITASLADIDNDQDVDGYDVYLYILDLADAKKPSLEQIAADFGRTDIPYKWEVQVKVTNKAGHRMPSGYPDGRRFWINLQVYDSGQVVYESGHYNYETATLYTDSLMTPFNRALQPNIDSSANAVMVYERVTGTCVDELGDPIFPDPTTALPAGCTASPALTNNFILFDNRILPAGFDYAALRDSGVKFYNYDPVDMVPYEDQTRFPAGQNWDVVTYSFDAPPDAVLTARAELYWQTHTREFMEHLKDQDNSTVRPEGPPNIFDINYPLNPNYLSDQIGLAGMTDLDGVPLRDNWGGIAYASWMLTDMGAPHMVAADDTDIAAPPAIPTGVSTTIVDPFTVQIDWNPIADAEGYIVWIRYGKDNTGSTADWDKLAVVYGNRLVNTAMNVGKTYAVKVQAFNGRGASDINATPATVFMTPGQLPTPPEFLQMVSSTDTSVELSWFDTADNEDGFVIERQDVPVVGDYYEVARIASQTPGAGTGGNIWTDNTVLSNKCFNYRVAATNFFGMSEWSVPVQACTLMPPTGSIGDLTATAVGANQIDLGWTDSGVIGTVDGYRIERSATSAAGPWDTVFNSPTTIYSDLTVNASTTYWYRVFAYNLAGSSSASNVASAATP